MTGILSAGNAGSGTAGSGAAGSGTAGSHTAGSGRGAGGDAAGGGTGAGGDGAGRGRGPGVRGGASGAAARFVALGLAGFVAVAAGCVLGGTPADGRWWLLGALLALAGAAWAAALIGRPTNPRLALSYYLAVGLAGCAVDLVQPSGPAFVLGYMALAGMGLVLPRLPALAGGTVVLVALGTAEAVTSDHPGTAALSVGLGAAFLFLAAQFAALSRDAQQRSAELVIQVESERAARESAAALAERTRLARELHDVLAHTLSGLALQLEATRVYATRTGADPALVEQVTVAQKLARQGMTGAKQAIAALRGAGTPGLAQLPDLIAEFRRTTGLPAELTVTGHPRPLGDSRELAAYRMVQESLSNVAKHEPTAAVVPVQVDWTADAVRVTVSNTRGTESREKQPGPGEPETSALPGFGLTGITERAAMLGGSVTVRPSATGFTVTCELPAPVECEQTPIVAGTEPQLLPTGGAG